MSLQDNAVAVLSGWEPDPTPYGGGGRDDGPALDEQRTLRDRYLDLLARHPNATRRDCVPAHVTASGIVMEPGGSATLLVLHAKIGLWVQPGGHCEATDRTLAAAALREVVEETGLERPAVDPDPVLLSVHDAPCGADLHYDVQHLIIAPRDSKITVSDESDDVRWFEVGALPTDLASGVPALIGAARRRISSAART